MSTPYNFYMHHTILIYFSFKYIDSHCARLKNVHHDFMKVIKNWIAFLWAPQKCAPRFYKGHKKMHSLCMSVSKMCITILWRSSKIAPLFMSVPKMRITIYEGPKKMHLLCMRTSTMRITVFYEGLLKCASPFYESFKISHHDIWRS